MIRLTAVLIAAALSAAPALALTPPTQEEVAAPAPINLEPGAPVKGGDGAVLGHLQDVRVNAAGGQELLVRDAQRRLRAVPLTGIRQDGPGVIVDWTMRDLQASEPVAEGPAAQPQPAPQTPPAPTGG